MSNQISTIPLVQTTCFLSALSVNTTSFCSPLPNSSPSIISHHLTCSASGSSKRKRRKRPQRRPTAFENTIDDLTMKRLGRGSIYYGERPVISEQDYQTMEEEEEDGLLKPDPILVTGATGRTGQWIALGLMNQGFNVRCFTRDFDNGEKIFGPSGSNLDVFPGNLTSYEDVEEAVQDSIAIVCASGAPWWLPSGYSNVDVKGVQNLITAAKKAGTVRRFVLISSADNSNGRGKAKRQAEKELQQSGIPYVIIRAPTLKNVEGGLTRIFVSTEKEKKPERATGYISRVDLAQVACQALVHNRAVEKLQESDPEGEFEFPNCIINAENGMDPYVPDKRFWKREFNRISDTILASQNVDVEATTEDISG